MKSMNTSERGLIASLIISDIISFVLVLYNFLFVGPEARDMIPIFLIIMPALYFDTKRKLEIEGNQSFQYQKVLWVLISCLIITEGMNLILIIL
ncbi:MAG: hypothetical protein ACFE9M_13415 [Promethearchaeota archaeon]